eukprot:1318565-Amphidinium_carterae.1
MAVQKSGNALVFAAEQYKGNREIVLAAVKAGPALNLAAEECKRDREIVLAAVQQCGWSLQYAEEHFRGDHEI